MVAYRSSATGTQTPNTDGTSVTVTKPASLASGDVMVAVVHGYLPASLTAPSGWQLIAGPINDSTALYSWLYTKTAGGSEPANYTWTWSGTGGTLGVSITAFSGCSGIDNWNVEVTNTEDPVNSTNDGTAQGTALQLDVLVWRDATSNTASRTGGAAATEAFDFTAKDAGTIWRGQAGYYHTSTSAPGTSDGTVIIDVTNSIERGIYWSILMGDSVTNESWASTGLAVELDLNGTWTDITTDVRYDGGVQITRGQSGEGSAQETSRATVMLDNRTGKYSPRNPNSAYYGTIGRNTPIRICKNQGTKCFEGLGSSTPTMRFQTIDKTTLAITGDLDIRIDVEPRTWKYTQILMAKSSPGDGVRQWLLYASSSKQLSFWWTTDGVNWNTATSDYNVIPTTKRQVLRATMDVNNGAGGYTVTFYSGSAIDGSWTTLDTITTAAGTTSIYAAASVPLGIGQESVDSSGDSGINAFHGKIYRAQVRNGIGGTIVADADFTSQTQGAKSFTDAYSNTWIGYSGAVISNRKYRFYGEVSAWPQRWDSTGEDVYVPIEAAGIRRRLETNSTPLRSAVYRNMVSRTDIIAYWPCEDGTGSKSVASGLLDGLPMRIQGSPTFGGDSRILGSEPVLQMNSASMSGRIPTYTDSFNQISLRFYLKLDTALATQQDICTLYTSGTVRTWTLGATGPGDLYLTYTDVDDNVTTDTLASITNLDGRPDGILTVTLELSQSGGNIAWSVHLTDFADTDYNNPPTVWTDTGTATTETLGLATKVAIQPFLGETGIGHIAVGRNLEVFADSATPMSGELGERSNARFSRILDEEGISADFVGSLCPTFMGVQKTQSLIDIVKQCLDTEHGILYEPREFLGLGFHTREALDNQAAQVALDYTAGHLDGDLWPDEDDALLKNDVTVTREDGSKARVELTSGALSTLAPPNGVGRYEDAQTLSLYEDDDCAEHAYWIMRLGTVDEARYPKVQIALENLRFAASSSLTEDALNADIGHRLTIDNPPSWLPPEDISLIIVGYTEAFDQFQHKITFVCVPASPYDQSGHADGTYGRVDTDSSSLSASATSSATSLTVATTGSYPWITSASYASDFPFDIMVGGERMTVTAITSATSPQTFTVTRSVNGISKAHAVGTGVHVFETIYVSF